jgi:pyroglutamyl-peptidase
MYGVAYTLAKKFPHIKGGFMHVPYIPSQVVKMATPAPCMSLRDITRGIEAAIMAIGKTHMLSKQKKLFSYL